MASSDQDEQPKGQREDLIMFGILLSILGFPTWFSHDWGQDATDIVACDFDGRGVIQTARSTCKREAGRVVERVACRLPDGIVLDTTVEECEAFGGTNKEKIRGRQ